MKTEQKLKAVFFDFDGVIIDSYQITIDYFQEVFKYFGLRIPSEEEFKPYMGLTTHNIFRSLFPEVPESKFEKMYEYSQQVSFRVIPKIPMIKGAIEVIEKLSKQFTLAIITSRGKAGMQQLLKIHHLEKYFVLVIDKDDITKHKPDPQGILKAMAKLRLEKDEVIYIGDMPTDVEAAHNAGIKCIKLNKDGEGSGADYVIENVIEVLKVIENIN